MNATELLPLAVDALIKATLVLAAAGAAALALRRRAASWRHLTWTTALVGALAMPAVAWFAPEWTAPIPLPLPLRAAGAPAAVAAPPAMTEPALAAAWAEPILTVDKLPALATGTLEVVAPVQGGLDPWALLLAAWAAGSVALLAWTVRAHLQARALVRRARPLRDPGVAAQLAASPIGRRVRLVESNEIDVPLATGLVHPVLIVPAGFGEWCAERRRVVLLHELAHVERGDCLALALARAAVAVWWFHPIAWFALARLRREAEEAADDRVLEAGMRPSEYAAHLLAVVQSLTGHGPTTAGLSMAGSNVERRLLAMLDPSRSRRRLSPTALVLCTLAVAGGVVALGGLRADAAPSKKPRPSALQAERSDASPAWSVGLVGDEHEGESVYGRLKRHLGHDEGAQAFAEAMKHHQAGDYEASAEGFRRAHEHGHAKGTSAFNVGCAHARLGRDKQAVTWLEQAFEDGFRQYELLDSDEDLAFLRGNRRFEAFREAMREQAAEQVDEQERVFEVEGDHLHGLQRKLETLWTNKTGRQGAEAYALGYERHGEEDWAGAEEAWRKAAALGYSPANSHYNVACALARQGRDAEALDWLEKAVLLGFDDLDNMGRDDDLASLRGRARFAEVREIPQALRPPGDINDLEEIRENRADWVAFTQRSGDLARRHPEFGKAWLQHGIGLLRTERFGEAAAAFRKAAEAGQPEGLCLWNEACALAGDGRKDQAVDRLDRALGLGFGSGSQLAKDPDLAGLEGHEGFEALKTKYPDRGDATRRLKEDLLGGQRRVY